MNNKNRYSNRWELCPFCRQIKLVRNSNHHCPEAVLIQREIEIERIVEEELLLWDLSEAEFWADNMTLYYQYLAETGEI